MPKPIVPESKAPATRFLAAIVGRINVFPDHDHALSRAESAVLHTLPVQRMTTLRQIGLGCLVWPMAEHTRFSHCLGTDYWATVLLDALTGNRWAAATSDGSEGNLAGLRDMENRLGEDLSLDLVVRLFGMVHDMALLPLGHTLHYQLGYLRSPGMGLRRIAWCLERIREELVETPEIATITDPATRDAVLSTLRRHLDVVECAAAVPDLRRGGDWLPQAGWIDRTRLEHWLPALVFVHDIITGPYSADIIDYAQRDSLGVGLPRSAEPRLMQWVCIGREADEVAPDGFVYRFAVNPMADGHPQDAVIAGLVTVIRARHEIAVHAFYHPAKCAADAVLDRALRTIDGLKGDGQAGDDPTEGSEAGAVSRGEGAFAETALLRIGDQELLGLIDREERHRAPRIGARTVAGGLLARRLPIEVFRVEHADATARMRAVAAGILMPGRRHAVESALLAEVPGLAPGDLIFGCRPPDMQLKKADVPIVWRGGRLEPLSALADAGETAEDLPAIDRAYTALWSASAYLHPSVLGRADAVRDACRRMFGATA